MPKYDLLWKVILEYTIKDFLTFFFPASKDIFDFNKEPIFLDKELQQIFQPEGDQYNPNFVDKLVKMPTLDGEDQWILVHIEVQGTPEKLFERRMFRYFSRIFDKYDKQITAFAILTDNDPKFNPTKYENEFLGTSLSYQFNSLKVLDQSIDELKKNSNPFACVLLAVLAAIKGIEQGANFTFQFKKELFFEFEERELDNVKKKAILAFLDYYVNIESDELERKFYNEVKKSKANYMNIDEVIKDFELERLKDRLRLEEREKATIEAKKEVVKNLLISNKLSISEISTVTGTSEDFVLKVKNEL